VKRLVLAHITKAGLLGAAGAAVACILVMQFVSTSSAENIRGDVTCDGLLNAVDALYILQTSANLIPLTSLPCGEDADISRDGQVNSIDATVILQFVAGLLPNLFPTSTPGPKLTPTPTPIGPGVEFSIGADVDGDGAEDCSTRQGDKRSCLVQPSKSTITLKVNLDAIPEAYGGFDVVVVFDDLVPLGEPDAQAWPDCVYDASFLNGKILAFGCAIGELAESSTYVGNIGNQSFSFSGNCFEAQPSVSLVHGTGNTGIVDDQLVFHFEAQSGEEELPLYCVIK